MDEGFAIIIAAILAVLGIFYTSRQQRKMVRKQHTFQVIDKLNGWKELDKCVDFAAQMIRSGTVPTLCDEAHASSCEKIDFLLNYYEVLASAIICGDVDEELVHRMERGRLTRSYLAFIPYIEENREERNSDKLWENLEFITYRWTTTGRDRFDGAIDTFFLRPNISHYQHQRAEIREFLSSKKL